ACGTPPPASPSTHRDTRPASDAARASLSSPLAGAFEELDLPLVTQRGRPASERSEIPAFAGARVHLAGVEPVGSRRDSSDHDQPLARWPERLTATIWPIRARVVPAGLTGGGPRTERPGADRGHEHSLPEPS